MSLRDLLKAKQNREEMERLQRAIEDVGALDYLAIRRKTEQAEVQLNSLDANRDQLEEEIKELNEKKARLATAVHELQTRLRLSESIEELQTKITERNNSLLVADDAILMESFSLYKPTYQFATAAEYKEKLDRIRLEQKSMIKSDNAAMGAQGWTVNNSAAQGRKLVNDMKKLCLRSFNNECEAAVNGVKFNNFDRCKSRVEKSADSIAKLGKIMQVSINPRYIGLKIQELAIALEYQVQKEKEKEELRELRAQQREEARVAQELEEARKESIKEQKHYQNALDTILKQIEACSNEEELEVLNAKKEELSDKLEAISDAIAQIDYREANQKAGYVYVISNIGSFGEGVYKIGMTRRLEPQERVNELGDASVPFNFDVHAMIFSDDAPALEAELHRTFSERKLNFVNNRREFFRVSLEEIKQVVKEYHDKSVEFNDIAPAEQYRESLRIQTAGIHTEV